MSGYRRKPSMRRQSNSRRGSRQSSRKQYDEPLEFITLGKGYEAESRKRWGINLVVSDRAIKETLIELLENSINSEENFRMTLWESQFDDGAPYYFTTTVPEGEVEGRTTNHRKPPLRKPQRPQPRRTNPPPPEDDYVDDSVDDTHPDYNEYDEGGVDPGVYE